jgi:hypothetical protein
VIVALGTNDITSNSTNATTCHSSSTPPTAAQMIAGFEQLAVMAHAAGVRIFAATIPPFHGSPSWQPAEEQTREQVNAWILNNQVLDGGFKCRLRRLGSAGPGIPGSEVQQRSFRGASQRCGLPRDGRLDPAQCAPGVMPLADS